MLTHDDKEFDKPEDTSQEVDDVTQIKYFGGDAYDGIQELDNPLPPWLKYIFYISIIVAVSYMTRLVVFHDDSIVQKNEYYYEMVAANAKAEVTAQEEAKKENTEVPETQEQKLAAGKTIFERTCVVCHGKFGEGLVGPNLTDDYWIHGGRPEDLKKTITDGVLDKGMLSFKSQLSSKQIDEVVAFVLSLHGTNPPNAKAPQGEKMASN